MGRGEPRVGSPVVLGERVPVSTDLIWFLVGIAVGTLVGVGATVVVAWRVVRGLVKLALMARENRNRGVRHQDPRCSG